VARSGVPGGGVWKRLWRAICGEGCGGTRGPVP
jgi:hypothetical protein